MTPEHLLILAAVLLAAAALMLVTLGLLLRRTLRTAQARRTDAEASTVPQIESALAELDDRLQSLEHALRTFAALEAQSRTGDDAAADAPPLPQSKIENQNSKMDLPPGVYIASQGDEIVRLHRQGLDALAIARRTHLPVGEVELVLQLDRCRRTPSGDSTENGDSA